MKKTPKSLRLQLGLFGRTNTGKSSFLNMVVGQDAAITSPIPGTTTDVVEKSMELLPVGPVVFLDTGGIDDISELGKKRIERGKKVLDRADIYILIAEPNIWSKYEQNLIDEAQKRKTPVIIIVNKIDIQRPKGAFLKKLDKYTPYVILCSSIDIKNRDSYVNPLKEHIISVCPDDFINPPAIIGDLIPHKGIAVLIVPIDKEAPKGRIILPQVQTIRDALDNGQVSVVVKESEYPGILDKFTKKPDIVVCDSQVVDYMVKHTPGDIACTTFSILFSRNKGELNESVRSIRAINELKDKDKILIAEACSHHPIEDDIGRVKIPRWLKEYTQKDIIIDTTAGRDYPDNLSDYKLVIHCGGCMITRREMLMRIQKAKEVNVGISNYGVVISYLHGTLERVLSPFKDALWILQKGVNSET